MPKTGVQRKVVATDAFKSENNLVVRKMQKHMCHSAATCKQFYQQTDNSAAVSSKRTIERQGISQKPNRMQCYKGVSLE